MNLHPTELRDSRTYLAADEVAELKLTVLPAGATVFPKIGGAVLTNKKRYVSRPGVVDLNTMGVTPGPRLDPSFLRLWFERLDLRTLVDGSVLPQISQKRARALQIGLPGLGEQRRIVELLDDHLSRLDVAERLIEASVARSSALRLAGLRLEFDHLHRGGVEVKRLGDVAKTGLGKMLDSKRAAGSPTPYLRNLNVRWGRVDTSDIKTVLLTDAERAAFALEAGDLLVCEGGEPGRCAVWRGSEQLMTFQKALHRVRVDPAVLNVEYVAAVLESAIKSGAARSLLTGTTIRHLPQERLKSLSLPVPDLVTQRQVVSRLDSTEEQSARLRGALGEAQGRRASLRRALLDAAFSGQLTGRSSDLDRAEELAEAMA